MSIFLKKTLFIYFYFYISPVLSLDTHYVVKLVVFFMLIKFNFIVKQWTYITQNNLFNKKLKKKKKKTVSIREE
jgi:hypothetical protein